MRFGIIGYGNIAKKFVKSIEATEGGKVTAIASRSVAADDDYLKSHPKVKLYRDYEDMLMDGKIDAVYIALTHKYHKEWILKALDYHIPVLCEKPMVLKPEEIEEIREKVYETKTYCLEALKTKFNDGYRNLRKDLSMIGDLTYMEANFCSDASKKPDTCFLFDPEQGGAINDIGSYVLGFILGLMEEMPEEVHAQMELKDGLDQYFKAELLFSNGCKAVAEGAIDRKKERTAIIEGTLGRIEIPTYNRIVDYKIIKKDGTEINRYYPMVGDDMTKEIQVFMDDVKAGKLENVRHSLDDSKDILTLIKWIKKV